LAVFGNIGEKYEERVFCAKTSPDEKMFEYRGREAAQPLANYSLVGLFSLHNPRR
jgi:hypothetical protein